GRAWWRGRRWWWWPSPRRWAPLCLAVGEGGTWGPSPRPHAKQPHQLAVRPSVPQNQQLSSSSSSSSSCQIALPASLPFPKNQARTRRRRPIMDRRWRWGEKRRGRRGGREIGGNNKKI
uniref:Uncharacterized protein n=1 Tax=Aegilops tauschii subsp. strangulata TaxID=200361 RepID=A0A453GD92_AEGTS